MDDGACAGNQVSRLPISKLTAGGKHQSTWEYNMPLCWLIQPTIRLNKLNPCRSSATAWWRWRSLTGKAQRRYSHRPRYLTLAVMSGRRVSGQFFTLGQETFSILRTFGRTKQVRCIFAFREVRESGLRRRLSSRAAWDTEHTGSSCAMSLISNLLLS